MARWCPEKQNFALYPDCGECEDRVCDAFWDGKSPGTRQNFALAKQFGNELKIVLV